MLRCLSPLLVMLLTMALVFSLPVKAVAREVIVGLEPLPPLVTKGKTGLTIDFLRQIEKHSALSFNIYILPYNRAKRNLRTGTIHLMGHTPFQVETQEFYTFAQELDWSLHTIADMYALQPEKLQPEYYKVKGTIGTPRGNEAFFAELYNIPVENFFPYGDIESLIKMLRAKRIDLFMFERVSSMTAIQTIKLPRVYYRQMDTIPVSLAVQKTPEGTQLKKILESTIRLLDEEKIFAEYLKYQEMPATGVIEPVNQQ